MTIEWAKGKQVGDDTEYGRIFRRHADSSGAEHVGTVSISRLGMIVIQQEHEIYDQKLRSCRFQGIEFMAFSQESFRSLCEIIEIEKEKTGRYQGKYNRASGVEPSE